VEQQGIAEILDAVDEIIRNTEQLIAKLQQVKQGFLHDLLTRGIDDNGEIRDLERHPEHFKDSQLGRIPMGWKVVPAGDVFDIQLGKMMSPAASTGPNQRRYLRNQNVLWDRLDLSDVATMHFDRTDLEKFRLRFGDLLACEGRFIGRCAIWRGEIDDAYYQKALHRLRARDDRSTTDYMLFFMSLRFQYDRGFVEQMSHESTIPHLPLEKLIALPMLLPPRVEQDHIVGRLRAIIAREQLESDYLAKAMRLKAGLMEDLLTGRVRVTNLMTEAAA
jgi:type I restriction enzyme S subunit